MKRRNRKIVVATTAVVAFGVPLGAHAWIVARTDALAAKLGRIAEVPSTIGSVDVGLTGTVRVSDIALGELVTIDAIEVRFGVGETGADEIRVTSPRLDIHVDPDGDSDLARLGRKLAPARPASPPTTTTDKRAPRRIVVDGGSLVAQVPGIGEVTADEVEVIPEDGGVRLVTGAVHVRGTVGPAQIKLAFPRAAAQIALPGARFTRLLAVAGTGTATTQGSTVELSDLSLGRLRSDGRLELHGTIADDGERRAIGATLQFAGADRQLELAVTGTRVPLAALAGIAPRALDVVRAHATGSATLRLDHQATKTLAIDASISDLALDHPRIAPEPLPFTGTIGGTFALSDAAIVVTDLAITRGGLHVAANGWLRRGAPISGQLEVAIDDAPCSQLFDALPAGLRAPLDGIVLSGELGGHAKLAIDLAAPEGEGVTLDAQIANHCVAVSEPPGADVTTLAGITTQTFPDGTIAKVGRGADGYIPLRGLPDHVPGAFTSAEDGRFREHQGFDPTQIARSLEIDLREHRLARGGSTISQQLVKNAFLTHRRSLDRKVQEAILTWRLEARLDKSQILERYLNIIELGPHVYGIGAAAEYWFATTPAKLTVRQAAFLAALTSAPTSMSARVRAARGLDIESRARVDTILRAMRRDGVIGTSEHDDAKSAALAWAPTVIATSADGY